MIPDEPRPTHPQESNWRWWVCLLLMSATVINYMDRLTLNQLSRNIKTAFELTNLQYSSLESAFSVGFAIGAFCIGMIVDRVSVRWVYPMVVLGWSVVGVLTGFSNSFAMLFGCRLFLGIFEAGNWPCGLRTTRAMLAPRERSFGNALFQSGTALGAVITPMLVLVLLKAAEARGVPDAWRVPFRAIGCVGAAWVVMWFLSVPSRMVQTVGSESCPLPAEGAARYWLIFRDPRFWVLIILVVVVNIPWHGYRSWLPLYLQEERGYSREGMSEFMTGYYLLADIGSWTVGLTSLGMCRWGISVHASRVIGYGSCSVLALSTCTIPFLPSGWPLEAGLLAVGFSALGLFPTYYALCQEISSKHQGKVTGTLGLVAHGSLAGIYAIEGLICDATDSYTWVLGGIGVFPILGFLVLVGFWRPPRESAPSNCTPTV